MCIGRGLSLNSELWVILHGFEVALMKGYDKVIIKTDCLTAMEMLTKDTSSTPTMTLSGE